MPQSNPDSETKPMDVKDAINFSRQQAPLSLVHRLSIWVLLSTYFFCVITWISPEGTLKAYLLPLISPIIYATSIGQSWSVFSPDVREANYHETALVSFKDGLQKL